jgi:hypothetical protein
VAPGDQWKQLPVHCGNWVISLGLSSPATKQASKVWRVAVYFQKFIEKHPSIKKGHRTNRGWERTEDSFVQNQRLSQEWNEQTPPAVSDGRQVPVLLGTETQIAKQ